MLREIVFEGAPSFEREALLQAIRLKTGQPLRRGPEALAQVLESFYRLEGYPAVAVRGRFDEGAGVLTLSVDEGTLDGVEVKGLPEAEARRAIAALGLELGKPLREAELWEALARLNEACEGHVHAVGETPYVITTTEGVTTVTFELGADTARVHFRGAGPRNSGRYNRVDGLAPGLFLELAFTDKKTYNHWRFFGVGAYGFSSKKMRYGVGFLRGLGPDHRWSYGYNYHDWTDTDDAFRRYGLEEARGGPVNTELGNDFYRRYGHELFVHRKLGGRAQVGVLFRSDDFRSLPVVTNDEPLGPTDKDYNPEIDEGLMRSFIVTARWVSRGGLFENQDAEARAVVQPSFYGTDWFRRPEAFRLDATYEVATEGMGSDFDFTRFIGRLRWRRELGDRFAVDSRILTGFTSGDPPLQKLFALGGLNTLRGYERKRIQGRRMALLQVEGALYPGRLWPALIGFWDGGGAWGGEPTAEGTRYPAGWRDDLGIGVRWPPRSSRVFGRVDVAWPLSPLPGQEGGPRVNFRFQLPF